MKNDTPNPIIRRNRHGDSECVEQLHLESTIIGYVVGGKLAIHTPQCITQIYPGELFVLHKGCHYVEHITLEERLYEEILFAPEESLLATILTELKLFAGIAPQPIRATYSPVPPHRMANNPLATFMNGIREYLNHDIFAHNDCIARMKTNELVYLLLVGDYTPLIAAIQYRITIHKISIEEFAHHNILADKGLCQLAEEYGLSLSGFKKEFQRAFGEPPHSWFMTKRLEMAAWLLVTTDDQVKAVAHACHFATSSHFIRLFRNKYHLSPAQYRLLHQPSDGQ